MHHDYHDPGWRLLDLAHQPSACVFAAILGDGSVVTWGKERRGSVSRAVQHRLTNVQQINTTGAALGDGCIVTWGDAECGC